MISRIITGIKASWRKIKRTVKYPFSKTYRLITWPKRATVKTAKSFKSFVLDVLEARAEQVEEQDRPEVMDDEVMLIVVDGADARVIWPEKESDDRRLMYKEDGEDMECKITSKPIIVDDTHLYFTRDGFKGTMALNKHTLLDSDAYSKIEDIQAISMTDEQGESLITEEDSTEDWIGQIESLAGSKATLETSNRALRERALLKPQKMSKTQLLLAVGTGVGVGLIIGTWVL